MSSKLILQIGRWVLTPAWRPNKFALRSGALCGGALDLIPFIVCRGISLSPSLLLCREIDALLMLQIIVCNKD